MGAARGQFGRTAALARVGRALDVPPFRLWLDWRSRGDANRLDAPGMVGLVPIEMSPEAIEVGGLLLEVARLGAAGFE